MKCRFEESHGTFLRVEKGLEAFLVAYLGVIFIKNQKTHDGLNILTKYWLDLNLNETANFVFYVFFYVSRFASVSQRNLLRSILNDKYVEMFGNYEKDLNEMETTYETYKVTILITLLFKSLSY
jgi:hypothetical protein